MYLINGIKFPNSYLAMLYVSLVFGLSEKAAFIEVEFWRV